jgi:hypothetical protein
LLHRLNAEPRPATLLLSYRDEKRLQPWDAVCVERDQRLSDVAILKFRLLIDIAFWANIALRMRGGKIECTG